MTATEPVIDLTKIEFPTDRLTVKMLRKVSPQGFDVEPPPDPVLDRLLNRPLRRQSLDDVLACVIDAERILAEMAFKSALGQSIRDDDRQGGRATIHLNLSSDYVGLGLAPGKKAAREMLKDIEAQAAAQAREQSGRPR
jgi:hypothetical protein